MSGLDMTEEWVEGDKQGAPAHQGENPGDLKQGSGDGSWD